MGKAWKNPLKKPQTKTNEKGSNCMKKRKPIQHAPDLMSKDEGALRSTNVLQKLKSKTRLHCLESKTEGDTALRKTRTMPALRNTAIRNAKSANAPRTTEVASRMTKYQNRKAKAEQGANPFLCTAPISKIQSKIIDTFAKLNIEYSIETSQLLH